MYALNLGDNSSIPHGTRTIQLTNNNGVSDVVRSLLETFNGIHGTEVKTLDLGDLLTTVAPEELKSVFLAFPPNITCLSVTSLPQICGVFPPTLQQLLVGGKTLPSRDLAYLREANEWYEWANNIDKERNRAYERVAALGNGHENKTEKHQMFSELKKIFTPPEGHSFLDVELFSAFKRWQEKYNVRNQYNHLFENLLRFSLLNKIKDLLKDAKDETSLIDGLNKLPQELLSLLQTKARVIYDTQSFNRTDSVWFNRFSLYDRSPSHSTRELQRLLAEACAQEDSEYIKYLLEICSVKSGKSLIKANHYAAFHQAVQNGHLDITKYFFESIADAKMQQEMLEGDNFSSLRNAIRANHLATFLYLLKKLTIEQLMRAYHVKGDGDSHEICIKSAQNGCIEFFEYLTEKLQPNVIRRQLRKIGEALYTEAIQNNHLHVLTYLHEDLRIEDSSGILETYWKGFYLFALRKQNREILSYLEAKLEPAKLIAHLSALYNKEIYEGLVTGNLREAWDYLVQKHGSVLTKDILNLHGSTFYRRALECKAFDILDYLEANLDSQQIQDVLAASGKQLYTYAIDTQNVELLNYLESRLEIKIDANALEACFFGVFKNLIDLELDKSWDGFKSRKIDGYFKVLTYLEEKLDLTIFQGILERIKGKLDRNAIKNEALQVLAYWKKNLGVASPTKVNTEEEIFRINILSWSQFLVDIDPDQTVLSLKQELEKKTGIKVADQTLFWGGYTIKDSSPLHQYNLALKIHLLVTPQKQAEPVVETLLNDYEEMPDDFKTYFTQWVIATGQKEQSAQRCWSTLDKNMKLYYWHAYKKEFAPLRESQRQPSTLAQLSVFASPACAHENSKNLSDDQNSLVSGEKQSI